MKNYYCPDCWVKQPHGGERYEPCGLTKSEHKRMAKLRTKAERQARQLAHQLMLEARERELLPRALINEIYDQTERYVKRTPRR